MNLTSQASFNMRFVGQDSPTRSLSQIDVARLVDLFNSDRLALH
jgi:hypothetical protein